MLIRPLVLCSCFPFIWTLGNGGGAFPSLLQTLSRVLGSSQAPGLPPCSTHWLEVPAEFPSQRYIWTLGQRKAGPDITHSLSQQLTSVINNKMHCVNIKHIVSYYLILGSLDWKCVFKLQRT